AVEHQSVAEAAAERRAEAPFPSYPIEPGLCWVPWAEPHLRLHQDGWPVAKAILDTMAPAYSTRDLRALVRCRAAEEKGARRDLLWLRRRASRFPGARGRLRARAMYHRFFATLAGADDPRAGPHLALALTLCAEHHFVPLALDCLVSAHLLR